MDIDYIIVQAGGIGSRLQHLTENKPKALVPVENLPMIFHLFQKYPDKKYIIIADYKIDVFKEYLRCFADVIFQVVNAEGSGTCGGIKQALRLIPAGKPFMLIWSDIILPEEFNIPHEESDYIGLSRTFPCRWSYEAGKFYEKLSIEQGVAGLFIFRDKASLHDVPDSGEFVRWMRDNNMTLSEIGIAGAREFGTIEEYEKLVIEKNRPFNKMTIKDGILTKEGIDEQGRRLAELERNWYEKAIALGVTGIPEIYGLNPLKMEQIKGKNIYECNFTYESRKNILEKLVKTLRNLHMLETVPADSFSLSEAYYNKTIERLLRIRDLIPFANDEIITINNKECRNIFFYRQKLSARLDELQSNCDAFVFIHGDCTFSNMMLKDDGEPVLIDPRGYFGYTKLYGDDRYDWAKLYYSIVGNYDRFNLGRFKLSIGESGVDLDIESNQWEDLEDVFFELTGADEQEIKLLHAVIWLSLTTYAWQNYDSICGAFYNGLYYLEDVL